MHECTVRSVTVCTMLAAHCKTLPRTGTISTSSRLNAWKPVVGVTSLGLTSPMARYVKSATCAHLHNPTTHDDP